MIDVEKMNSVIDSLDKTSNDLKDFSATVKKVDAVAQQLNDNNTATIKATQDMANNNKTSFTDINNKMAMQNKLIKVAIALSTLATVLSVVDVVINIIK